MKELLTIIFAVSIIILVAAVLPCLFIWSVNTLFNLHIEYEAQNIFAAFILLVLMNSNTTTKK